MSASPGDTDGVVVAGRGGAEGEDGVDGVEVSVEEVSAEEVGAEEIAEAVEVTIDVAHGDAEAAISTAGIGADSAGSIDPDSPESADTDSAESADTDSPADVDAEADTDAAVTAPLVARATTVTKSPARRRRTTVTFYLTDALRNRARAVYRATSFDERDGSWSEMLTKALLAEVERRELAHNDGRPFIANGDPLTPGRPIGF